MNVLIRTVFAAMTRRSQLSDMFVVVVVLMPLSIHLCLEILKNLVHIELLTQFGYALGLAPITQPWEALWSLSI